ncbi:MAG: RdgB/HAM1 family non-canonical purine NTP pyrophosphatase [Acidobacteria bacterium]|nr:RdgB/HAM1 family non-canonical purine NTP pyrophosphatase [Acidobacteriota bacterium]
MVTAAGIIVVATRNTGKLGEFRVLLAPLGKRVLSLEDAGIDRDIEESGATFAENARIKALEYSRMTPHTVLADDSGLEVRALGGRPGVFSARYAGPGASDRDRNRKLLEQLEHEDKNREARFFCALAMARGGALILETSGECRGIIARAPRGENGFGYDPVFLIPELDKTFGEFSLEEKSRYSHRSRAARNLIDLLKRNN